MRAEGMGARGSEASDEGIADLSVHWRSLSVHFGAVQALASCSGDVQTGELVALMGPTGSGKSSLLNAISRRGPATTGVVWYGENLQWSKGLKRHVAFVEQVRLPCRGSALPKVASVARPCRGFASPAGSRTVPHQRT
jgi:ABC-type cobalamin/Fe3+-siderophores transport system ATPase subunit